MFILNDLYRELSFNKGEIVYITRKIDNNWFEGEHHGKVGIFPISYVEVCDIHAQLEPMSIPILIYACWLTLYASCARFVCCCCQKISPSDRHQPARPPPPTQSTEIGEAVARYNFSADTNVELSLRKARLSQCCTIWCCCLFCSYKILEITWILLCTRCKTCLFCQDVGF